LAGIAIFTAASFVGGSASSFWLLVAARGVQGVGAAAMMALTLAVVRGSVSPDRIGSAMGLLGTTSAIGTALGPSLGGLLIAVFGWRSIFFLNLPLGLAAFLLARRHLPIDPPAARRAGSGSGLAGAFLLIPTLVAYALAMTLGRGSFGPTNVALLGAAGLGAGLFALAETRATAPLVDPSIFRHPTLGARLAMTALVSAVVMATLVVGPFYLSICFGLDAAAVGLVLSIGPAAVALCGVPAGRAVDRLGAGPVTAAGLLAMTGGCSVLFVSKPSAGVPGYVAPIVLLTVGYALFQTANNTAVLAGAPAGLGGLVSGVLTLSRNLGLVTGASFLGAVFAWASGGGEITSAGVGAVAHGMRSTFGVAALLILLALAIWGLGGAKAARRLRSEG
ncbi:MAG: MFS transporter, partial [Acidobacteria bacterium]|nr:MFS transporter [Acidobacteriota bacterium]